MTTTIKQGQPSEQVVLRAGDQLVVTTAASSAAIVERYNGNEFLDKTTIAAGTATPFGEYLTDMEFRITCLLGSLTHASSRYIGCRVKDAVDALGALHTSGDGVPADAVQASKDINPVGDDNGLTFTAVAYGAVGNAITIAYTDPGANDALLSVGVNYNAITVSLATGVAGAITSTAAEVLAAIEASEAASALVTVAIMTGDSGTADDGSGVVTAIAATHLASGAGSGIGVITGGLYSDFTNGKAYVNGGTAAAPVWKLITSAA